MATTSPKIAVAERSANRTGRPSGILATHKKNPYTFNSALDFRHNLTQNEPHHGSTPRHHRFTRPGSVPTKTHRRQSILSPGHIKIATGNIHTLEISTTDATAQDIATILKASAHVHTLSLISIHRHQINPTEAMDLVDSHFRAVAAARNSTNTLSLFISGIAIPYCTASISVSTSHPESPTITWAPAPRNVPPK